MKFSIVIPGFTNGFSWERNTREILDYLQEIIDAKGADCEKD